MADLYEVHTTWHGVAGTPYYSTLRGLLGSSVSPTVLAQKWVECLTIFKGAIVSPLVAVIEPEVTIIDSTTGKLVGTSSVPSQTIAATGSTDALPPMTQALVQLGTNTVTEGRRLRGRLFIPGMLEANNTVVGQPSAALTESLDQAFAAMVSATQGGWVVYSRTHHTYALVQSAKTWNQWAVMRSRRD